MAGPVSPQPSIRPTNARSLVAVAVAVGLLSWAVVSTFYGDIPPLRWYMPVGTGLVAVAEFLGGRVLRRRINRTDSAPPPDPLIAARAVVLGKASAYLGAAGVGLWLGAAIYPASQWGYLLTAKMDTAVAVIGVAFAGALIASGLWLERICRIPSEYDDTD